MLRTDPTRHRILKHAVPEFREIASLDLVARELFENIRSRNVVAWPQWLEKLKLYRWSFFAKRLRRDQHAVFATLKLPWSNGLVKGQIQRLELPQATDVLPGWLQAAEAPRPARSVILLSSREIADPHGSFTNMDQNPNY